MKEFLSIKELSEYLGIKPKTLYSWVESGKIPAYKFNGALRFKTTEINAFVNSNKVQPKNAAIETKKIIGKRLKVRHNRLDSGQKAPRNIRI
jgi:excisionase family DNA binding protein